MTAVLLVLSYLAFPAAAIYACQRFAAVRKVGVVLLCYLAGMILASTGLVSAELNGLKGQVADLAVAVALPLLLFSVDVRSFRLAGRALLSFVLAAIAVIVVAVSGYYLIRDRVPEALGLLGMGVGVYIGGTPNLAALKAAFGVSNDTFIVMHAYDTILSLLYIAFVVSMAQSLFQLYLRPFAREASGPSATPESRLESEEIQSYRELLSSRRWPRLALALGLSGLAILIAYAAGQLANEHTRTAASILVLTTVGITGSLVPAIRRIERTFQLGMYVIFVFCFTVGSMVDIRMFSTLNYPVLGFVALCIFGSMLLHSLLCRVFNIDADCFLVTSVAAICSPPFIPPVVQALRNPTLLAVGVITGIIGYAVANYLGVLVVFGVRLLGGF